MPSTTLQICPIENKQDNISENNGEFYTNDMYLEAEKMLKQREYEIEMERKKKLDKEIE